MMWWGNWGWGMGLMMLVGLIFWGSIIWLIIWGITRLTRREVHSAALKPTPLDIARERYARGEITREQFEQIKKDLNR
jgi:putative membrane protein